MTTQLSRDNANEKRAVAAWRAECRRSRRPYTAPDLRLTEFTNSAVILYDGRGNLLYTYQVKPNNEP